MAKKYNLYDIPLKQSFANSGLTQRVPYQLNPKDDDLNWLEGFTDAYQRPVLADDTQQGNGRYIKMGQLNQILQNLSQAILNVKQGLDNVSGKLDDKFQAQIDKIVADAEHTLANQVVKWLQTKNNQNCAGLKNFTGVNINNFKNSPTAVANLEWCNGLPIKNYYGKIVLPNCVNVTITKKNVISSGRYYAGLKFLAGILVNNRIVSAWDANDGGSGFNTEQFWLFEASNKDIVKFSSSRTICFFENQDYIVLTGV